MRRAIRTVALTGLAAGALVLGVPGAAHATDNAQAMDRHMELMAADNPGHERMMELSAAGNPGMPAMMAAPGMSNVHPNAAD